MAISSETRPWGTFYVLDEQPNFKVKRIEVSPGGRLSLQSHQHRAEHWVVAQGEATITVGDQIVTLTPGQSIDVPLGAIHRLENHGVGQMAIIEVQFGHYLGEDDITRYEDAYQRT